MAHKKWVIRQADKERASAVSEKFNIDAFVAFLLVSRGITEDADIAAFLSDSYMLASPFDFVDMEEASFVIGDAIDNGDKICIYGDYDCDGVTSTALLYSYLRNEGADVCYYIPSRENEGYGLNDDAVDKIAADGVKLIITVDNGISAVEQANRIYDLGMQLVITDHHQIGDELPRAEAVVNPHRPENNLTFREYCGVGIAFKLVCAMYDGYTEDILNEYADFAAVGTIADVMPLTNENRSLVRAGLEKINKNPRPSIKAFIESNSKKEYTANDIAFQLCPRINAMGRMGDASRAVEFLISEDFDECREKCNQLNLENSNRQETEKNILEDIENKISENPSLVKNRVIVIDGEGYHHGVIGIVASHLVDKYGKPSFVIGVDENGVARGSARSVDGFNIFDAISACGDDLIKFGGHPLAAGITLDTDKISDFRAHINDYAKENYPTMPPLTLTLDYKISPFYLTLDLANALQALEPYGAGNPQAVFGVFNMNLRAVTPLKDGKHVKLELEKKGRKIWAVWFGQSFDAFPYKVGDLIDLAVKISVNHYNEKVYLSVHIVDARLSSTDDDAYFAQLGDYNMFLLTGKGNPSLYPDRQACKTVYSFLKHNGGWNFSLDDLYFRLQSKINYSQLMFALKAFVQSGLINYDSKITLNNVENKVNLEDTKILKTIKERLISG